MINEQRIKIEERIVRRYINALEQADFSPVHIDTGGGREKYEASKLFEADEARVFFLHKSKPGVSWLYFVYGNEPGEVLNDYTTNLEGIVQLVNTYAERWM